jgi:integrase
VASKKPSSSPRFRVGKVSVYLHHGAWWVYYREHGRPVRAKVSGRRRRAICSVVSP